MMTPPSCATSSGVESLFVSADLATKIELGLEQLETVRAQMVPLIAKLPGACGGDDRNGCRMRNAAFLLH